MNVKEEKDAQGKRGCKLSKRRPLDGIVARSHL